MIEIIIQNIRAFSAIFLILVVAIIIIIYLFNSKFKEFVSDNWIKFRDNPVFLFFGGIFKREEGENVVVATFKNFVRFINEVVKKVVNILMWPFVQLAGVFVKMLGKVSGTFNNFRKQFVVMKKFMFKLTDGVMNRLDNINTAFTMFFLKAREGLKKQAAIFNLIAWTVAHSYYFLYSTVAGPVGNFFKQTARLQLPVMDFIGGPPLTLSYIDKLCFHPMTRILLENGESLFIKDINCNDKDGIDKNIIGKMEVIDSKKRMFDNQKCVKLYKINDTWSTGSHYIFSDGIFELNSKVGDLVNKGERELEIMEYDDILYCLITGDGKIRMEDGSIYGDYLDGINNNKMRFNLLMNEEYLNYDSNYYDRLDLFKEIYQKLQVKSFNQIENQKDDNDRVWGYSPESIFLLNGEEVSFSNINTGDIIDGNQIVAKIEIPINTIDVYELDGVKLSKTNLVWRENKWKRVGEIEEAVYIGKNDEIYINFIIDKSILYVKSEKGILISRDYLEIEEGDWNEYLESL
jgi:hypothetical protein